MNWLMLSLTTLVVNFHEIFSASLPLPEFATEENIKSNLIDYEYDLIEGLAPPLLEAENYFSVRSAKSELGLENAYIVEIHAKYLNIKTTGLPVQKIRLNQTETEGIQKLSLAFVELLNSSKLSWVSKDNEAEITEWKDVNPVIILTNSGISIQFLNISKIEPNATDISLSNRLILWDFLTKYAKNIFEEKLKQLKESEKFAEIVESSSTQSSTPFQNFVNFLFNVMRLSVSYAETSYEGWTTSKPHVIVPEEEKKVPSTTASLFAYEEPSPFHEFPSQEFQYRRKDIDSIFYGKGVI